MKQFLFILLCFVSGLVTAQETNCTNGIDDDGDGLIDCFDGDCFSEAYCPVVFDQTPSVCEDSFGSGNATVDLTSYDASITGGASHTVSWYQDTSAVGNPILPVASPTSYTATNGEELFAEVDNGTNQDIAVATFTVNNLPVVIDQSPNICEDVFGSGQSTVDLTALEVLIDGGNGYAFNWYEDALLSISLADPSNTTVTNGQQFFASVDNGNCIDTATVSYTVNSLDDAGFNYASATYCPTDTDPTATITGDLGGTFSATAGLAIDIGTGEIDLSASTPGNHTITYTTNGTCPASSTFDLDITDDGAPSIQPAANVSCDAFTATWNPVFGASSYEVDVAEDSNFATIVSGYNATSTTDTFLNVTGLTAAQTYFYRVRSITSCGTSINSDTISVDVLDIPVAVTNLTASNPGCDGFKVSWDAVTYASSYLLEISQDGFATVDVSQSIPSTSLLLTVLNKGTTYDYRVTPQNVCGSGPAVAGVYQTNDVPAIPTNVASSQVVCDGAILTWDEVLDATQYRVDISADTFVTTTNYTVSNDTLVVSGLASATTYAYRIIPENTCGTGDTTIIQTFTTDSLPTFPADTLLSLEYNQAVLAWDSIVNANTYSVEVATDLAFSSVVSTISVDSVQAEITGLLPLTTYYARTASSNTCGTSIFSDTLTFTTPQNPLVIDSLALVDLYNNTNGANWTDNTNWLSGNIETWHGVSVANNRVASLQLGSNQLSGTLPTSLSDLEGLVYADLRNNALTGTLGDWISNFSNVSDSLLLSGNQLTAMATSFALTPGVIDVSDNQLTFEDLLSVVDSLPNLLYHPQATVGATTNTFRNVEDSYTLSLGIDAAVTDNQYIWFRDGVAVDTTTVDEYTMDPIIVSDDGVYICEVTNSGAPDLTLVSYPMTVNVQAKPNNLTFTAVANVSFGTDPFVLNASASSGLPVQFEVIEGDSLVQIQGDMVTMLGIGSVTVRATQPGDDFHEAATPITREFTINQGSQTIAFTAISDQDISLTDSITLAISASSGLDITIGIDGPAELDGSTLWLLDTGTVTVTASQIGSELYQPAFPVSQSFLVFTSDTVTTTEPSVDSTINYSITVQVTSADAPISVSLYQASGSEFFIEQEEAMPSGSGVFSEVPGGFYSIQFTPSNQAYLPTYLGDRLTLAQASIFGLVQDTTFAVSLIAKPDTTAQTGVTVSGSLVLNSTSGGRLSETSSVANVPVYLVRTDDQSVVGYGSTNSEGSFRFPNIPADDYFFLVDYEGIDMRNNQIEVTDKSLALSVVADRFVTIVNVEENAEETPPSLITGLGDDPTINIVAYPNPVVDRVTVGIPRDLLGSQLTIINTAGQQVLSQILTSPDTNVSLRLLPPGLYHVQIQDGSRSHLMKVVKK
ncbi:MAG: T9SS type A sorting domain-containing protein [Bacteroidota bacterium]